MKPTKKNKPIHLLYRSHLGLTFCGLDMEIHAFESTTLPARTTCKNCKRIIESRRQKHGQKLIDAINTAYTNAIALNQKSYRIDTGEGSQQVTFKSLDEMQKQSRPREVVGMKRIHAVEIDRHVLSINGPSTIARTYCGLFIPDESVLLVRPRSDYDLVTCKNCLRSIDAHRKRGIPR